MKIKRKLMALSLAGVAGLGIAIGGATYAIFSSTASVNNNQFTAGTLHISSNRDDVPTVGPMFYTDSTPGMPGLNPTDLWAPGDKNTRGLFLKNDGTLPAKLKSISITNAPNSNPVVNSKFAQKARVIVWQVKWYNSTNLNGNVSNLNATQMDKIMNYLNEGYKKWASTNPVTKKDLNEVQKQELLQAENTFLLQYMNDIVAGPGQTYKDDIIKVTDLYSANLSDLTNTLDASSFDITTDPDKAQLLAFTVELPLDADNNYQDITANFNFNTYWEQVRNN